MPRFITSRPAERDISEIAEYIARDNPARALSFMQELRSRISEAARQPLAYRERADIKPGIRAAHHARYLIVFRFDGEIVEVLRVVHGARDLRALMRDLEP